MTVYCTVLLAQDKRPEIQAACIQADAALQAGMAQAAAATDAGWLTLGAGAFAVIAAAIAAFVTVRTTRNLIAANRAEQAKQRSYDLKSDLYAKAVAAVAIGLQVITRMANLEMPSKDVLSLYTERMSDLFGVQLVGELPTISKFMVGVQQLGKMHLDLMKVRPRKESGKFSMEEWISWARTCTEAQREVVKDLAPALVALRSELDMPIDGDEYRRIITEVIVAGLENNERVFKEFLAMQTGS